MSEPRHAQRLVEQLMAEASPEESRALLQALLDRQASSVLERLQADQQPTLRPAPTDVRGYRVRLDLHGAKPPVWRRLELPGSLTLSQLHDVIQAAMGWFNSHLHRFRTGSDHRSPYFVTPFDLEEGEQGVLEDEVRLDQLVHTAGDQLWYEYDFGDGWDHVLKLEEVLDEPSDTVRCTGGRMACPPEDCGGLGGYKALASWVRSGYDDTLLPAEFEDAVQARDWLPPDWDPDRFDVEETNVAVASVVAEPVAVTGGLTEIAEQLERRGVRLLREVLSRPSSHGPTDVIGAEAARLTETFRVFLDVVGEGVALTGAGYLPPAAVQQFAERSGITDWWIGKANREDLTPPVARVRESARALGLVGVRQGRLKPTAAGTRCRQDPPAAWLHIVERLPLGSAEGERDAGWLALAVAGSGVPAEQWRDEISAMLVALGWSGADRYSPPRGGSPTLDVLDQMAGAVSSGWSVTGTDDAVAATARAVIRRG
jgi:hypothetical protein